MKLSCFTNLCVALFVPTNVILILNNLMDHLFLVCFFISEQEFFLFKISFLMMMGVANFETFRNFTFLNKALPF